MHPYLDLQQLKAFYLVARTGSFTRAAQTLGRTQSAVSHAVRKLEEGLGIPLLERSGRAFHLTEEGTMLHASLETVYYTLDEAMESISQTRGEQLGRVRLGATVEFGCAILVKQMAPFITATPDVELEFHFDHQLLDPLLADDLDIIVDCVDHQVTGVERTPLFRELYAVVCSPGFADRHELEHPSQLSRCPVISMDRRGEWWYNFIYSLPGPERPALTQHRLITINLIRAMISAAEEGIGVALVPYYSVIHELERGSLVRLFPHIHLLEDQFTIYQKRSRSQLKRHRLVTGYLLTLNPQELSLPRTMQE